MSNVDRDFAESNSVYDCLLLLFVPRIITPAQQTDRCAVQSASVSCRAGVLTYYVTLRAVVCMT